MNSPAILQHHHLVLFEWLSGPEFLIRKLAPFALSVQADIDDAVNDVLAKIPIDTRTFVFHLNCTMTSRFPRTREALVEALLDRGLELLNDQTTDISKAAVQQCCREAGLGVTLADRSGDPDEPIIVKTNLNFAGQSEWALSEADRTFLGLGRGSRLIGNTYHYFVVSRKDVDDAWWRDENLICERFVSNFAGHWYRAYVLKDRIALCLLSSRWKVKKVGESRLERTWFLDLADVSDSCGEDAPDSVLSDLKAFKQAFQLDFGTVDIVIDESGRPFIIDVNTTPAYHHHVDGLTEHLASCFH